MYSKFPHSLPQSQHPDACKNKEASDEIGEEFRRDENRDAEENRENAEGEERRAER